MNKKEVSEIRRRLSLENSGADSIRGCYINEKREIVSEFELPLATFPDDEREKYLGIFRKVLSGGIGKNLINVDFSVKRTEAFVCASERYKRQQRAAAGVLRKSRTGDTRRREMRAAHAARQL